jgi:crotonobetainyl-CoA:carnitine CoA-transferase CaiB-like acyl-CoA transferase
VALPLEGILVVDLTQNVAGPFCTQTLGDMGAEVVKVERPGRGDDARAWAPPWWGTESATFMAFNRNKRSLALDLKREGGLKCCADSWPAPTSSCRAAARRDRPAGTRLSQGHHAQSAARLLLDHRLRHARSARAPAGLRPADAGVRRPDVSERPPGQEPARVGTSIVDMGTGMWAALGIMAGLRQRDATGRAVEVTTALFETALMWVSYHAMGYLGSGEVPQAHGSGTADDRALSGAAQRRRLRDDRRRLGRAVRRPHEALGVPELARDPRYADNPSRVTVAKSWWRRCRADPHAHDQRPARSPPRRRRARCARFTRWTRC